MVLELSEINFEEEVLKSNLPVMVDFWAAWCGPCRSMGSVVEQVGADFAGRVKVAKLNVDENQSITQRYGIRGIPTLLFFQDGKVVAQEVGFTSKEAVIQKLDQLFSIGQ